MVDRRALRRQQARETDGDEDVSRRNGDRPAQGCEWNLFAYRGGTLGRPDRGSGAMIAIVHFVAFVATVAGCAFLYLSAPRQQWLPRPWAALPSRLGGGILLSLGLLLWCAVLHPATAVFTTLTVAMGLFIALPFSAALSTLLRKP